MRAVWSVAYNAFHSFHHPPLNENHEMQETKLRNRFLLGIEPTTPIVDGGCLPIDDGGRPLGRVSICRFRGGKIPILPMNPTNTARSESCRHETETLPAVDTDC